MFIVQKKKILVSKWLMFVLAETTQIKTLFSEYDSVKL